MSSKVYILCGKIASGKTTYASEVISKKEPCVLLSVDEVMLQLYDGCLKEKHQETVNRILAYFYTLIPQLLKHNISCIIDYGFWTKKERQAIQKDMHTHEFPYEMLYIKTKEEERIQRLIKRNEINRLKEGRQFIIEGTLLEKLDAKFEEPSKEEIKWIEW